MNSTGSAMLGVGMPSFAPPARTMAEPAFDSNELPRMNVR